MPRGDRTGPSGLGSLTGRATGYCTGYSTPGFMNPTPGFGRGRGRGYGRGWGRDYGRGWWKYKSVPMRPLYADIPVYRPVIKTPSPEQEVAALENYQKELEAEKADLEQEMNHIESRIEELKATIK